MLCSEHGKPKRCTERLPKVGTAALPRRQAAAAGSSAGGSGPAGRGTSAVGGSLGPAACRGWTKVAEESWTCRAQAALEGSRPAADRARPEAWPTSLGIRDRFVDLLACGTPDRERVRGPLPSFASLADSAAAGMELPAAGGRALERDETKIRGWKRKRWPEIKKKRENKDVPLSSSTKAD